MDESNEYTDSAKAENDSIVASSSKRKTKAQTESELDQFAYFLLDLFEEKKAQEEQNPLSLIE